MIQPKHAVRRLLPLLGSVLVSLSAGSALATPAVYRITVSGMVCSFCAQGIEKRIRALPGTESVQIDLSKRLVQVTARPGASLDLAALRKAILDAGYNVRTLEGPETSSVAQPARVN